MPLPCRSSPLLRERDRLEESEIEFDRHERHVMTPLFSQGSATVTVESRIVAERLLALDARKWSGTSGGARSAGTSLHYSRTRIAREPCATPVIACGEMIFRDRRRARRHHRPSGAAVAGKTHLVGFTSSMSSILRGFRAFGSEGADSRSTCARRRSTIRLPEDLVSCPSTSSYVVYRATPLETRIERESTLPCANRFCAM